MPEIKFDVAAAPVAQPRPRACIRGTHASVYEAERDHPIHAFKALCKHAAKEAYAGTPLAKAVALSVVFVFQRPKSLVWATKPMPRLPHTARPDLDNLMKAVQDAWLNILFVDDAKISRIDASKWYASGDEQPHVRVRVSG